MILDTIKELGFRFATRAGVTVSKNDIVTPANKEEILERATRPRSRRSTSSTCAA